MSEGLLQISAGVSLVVSSGLLKWDYKKCDFKKNDKSNHFYFYWQDFDKQFGRAAMWNIFSTGAELLLKGLLLHKGKIITDPLEVWQIPNQGSDLNKWALRVVQKNVNGFTSDPSEEAAVRDYTGDKFNVCSVGALNDAIISFKIWHGINTKISVANLQTCTNEIFVVAAFDLLRSTIRNRDTHSYVPNVREKHEWLASELFLKAFNTCLDYLPSDDRKQVSNIVAGGRPRVGEERD